MHVERLIALARNATLAAPCEIWRGNAATPEGVKNEKRPMTNQAVRALAEIEETTLRDFGLMAAQEGVSATDLLARCEPQRAP